MKEKWELVGICCSNANCDGILEVKDLEDGWVEYCPKCGWKKKTVVGKDFMKRWRRWKRRQEKKSQEWYDR